MVLTTYWFLDGEATSSPYKITATNSQTLFSIPWDLVVGTFDFDDYEPDPISAAKSFANSKINDLVQAISAKNRFHPIAVTVNKGLTSKKPLKIIDGRHRAIAFSESKLDIVLKYHGVLSDATNTILKEIGARGLTIQSSGLTPAAADFKR